MSVDRLNVRIGGVGQLLAPGFSFCERCKTPWRFVEGRTVWYYPSRGHFALCVKCWEECSEDERVKYHRQAVFRYSFGKSGIPPLRVIEAAVRRES